MSGKRGSREKKKQGEEKKIEKIGRRGKNWEDYIEGREEEDG